MVEADDRKIKIYSTKGGKEMIGKRETIFSRKDFMFDYQMLRKFITFEEF